MPTAPRTRACRWCRCRSRRRSPARARRSRAPTACVVLEQRARRGQRVRPARADRRGVAVGLDDVAGARTAAASSRGRRPAAAPPAGAARDRCASPWPARPRRARRLPLYSLSCASNFSNSVMPSAAAAGEPGQRPCRRAAAGSCAPSPSRRCCPSSPGRRRRCTTCPSRRTASTVVDRIAWRRFIDAFAPGGWALS